VFVSLLPETSFAPDKLTLLIAWNPQCVGCEPVKRLVQKFIDDHPEQNPDVYTINVDEHNSVWLKDVRSLPSVVFIKDNTVLDSISGSIERYLKKSSGRTD
jgi:thiol-disulfide isomerase/thioredoxin